MAAHSRPASRQPAPRGNLRPFARTYSRERRLGRRIAFGLTPAQAARAEGIEAAEVERLLADPGFAGLVEEFRALDGRPDDELRRTLTRLARLLLEEAVGDGDVGAALFILREERRGRDPARTLADGVIAAHRRPARTPTPRPATSPEALPSPPSSAPLPAYAGDRAASRIAARLREAVRIEHATLHRAAKGEAVGPEAAQPAAGEQASTAATPATTQPAVATATPATRQALPPPACVPRTTTPLLSEGITRAPNRKQRRRLAALARRRPAPASPPARVDRPSPRSRGP